MTDCIFISISAWIPFNVDYYTIEYDQDSINRDHIHKNEYSQKKKEMQVYDISVKDGLWANCI